MGNLQTATFHHRQNDNGTFDSICPYCYLTIACEKDEQHLFLDERFHECDPIRLFELASGPWPLYGPNAA